MDEFGNKNKKAEVIMRFSEFEIPPMQDVLIIGKQAPIGTGAIKRMVELLSPEQYEIVKVEHSIIEAVVVRKTLFNLIPKDKLIELVFEEGGKIANESLIIKAQLNITVQVSKSIAL